MKTSQAMRLTRKQIRIADTGASLPADRHFICCAAEAVGVRHIVVPVIEALLGNKGTLDGWLMSHHRIYTGNDKKAQVTRKAWLAHLIAHYEALGD